MVIENGRLIQTPWPAPPEVYPMISLYLAGLVEEQIAREEALVVEAQSQSQRKGMFRDTPSTIFGKDFSFDIDSDDYPYTDISKALWEICAEGSGVIRVCDFGGSTGGAITKVLSSIGSDFRARLDLTVTSLVTHDSTALARYRNNINHYYERVSAELPPEEFYEAFDLIVSVKGPLHWSMFPEIVALNFWKMLKPGGQLVAVASNNGKHYDIQHGINVAEYLRESGLFHVEDWYGRWSQEWMRLSKN